MVCTAMYSFLCHRSIVSSAANVALRAKQQRLRGVERDVEHEVEREVMYRCWS